jgi:hypothetical protein
MCTVDVGKMKRENSNCTIWTSVSNLFRDAQAVSLVLFSVEKFSSPVKFSIPTFEFKTLARQISKWWQFFCIHRYSYRLHDGMGSLFHPGRC